MLPTFASSDKSRHLTFISLHHSGLIGYVLSIVSVLWCTWSASTIFVAVLRMSEQRLLVAYPVGLLYGCFALLSVFSGSPVTGK